MRLDKFLKVSRLIKRRTVAHDAAEAGRVTVNGKEVKPSHPVKPGDILELGFGQRILKVEITEIREVVRKDEASAMYREL